MNTEDKSHQAISSLFIGPKAENLHHFRDNLSSILDRLELAREKYQEADQPFITTEIQNSDAFLQKTAEIRNGVLCAADLLAQHSIPFWTPRYQGHMSTDMTMPALLGYFMTMIYNPNNVAFEASPLTTLAEIDVGKQLCRMFGYNIDPGRKDVPTGWGHITCDGTVANLESVWVSRNLKFYPLSLRNAMSPEAELSFVADTFTVETCMGENKLFTDLSTWELLNLKPGTVLDMANRLHEEYDISESWLESVMNKYIIQSTGKDTLERDFEITKPIQTILSTTRHYSWPKSAAIAGLGSDNIVGIRVDNNARVDIEALEEKLIESLKNEQAVYAVVAIIGSTEEGAVDNLPAILALRKKYQAKGLSFLIHADAAWGGYFCTMLAPEAQPIVNIPNDIGVGGGYVPDFPLREDTQEALYALRFADSITVDPHKAGYVPYPAGSLCYLDGRMRHLITWTSPYLSRGATDTSIGIYGVEGSKPGAAAMATYLSNYCVGLNLDGYGALLGEATFTSSRFSAEWAAMSTPEDSFVVIPFNMLPSEMSPNSTPALVEAEKQRIRDQILSKSNETIAEEDLARPPGQKAMELLRALGSDTNINCFSVNFRMPDMTLNEDTEEANYLMQRVIEQLSIDSADDDPLEIPFYLTSTTFEKHLYGTCAENFKSRLGLQQSNIDLFVFRNVVMSPFPTAGDFVGQMSDILKEIIEEAVKVVRLRNEVHPERHTFLMQGTEKVYLVHFVSFAQVNFRRQVILEIDLPRDAMEAYASIKVANPGQPITLSTSGTVILDEVIQSGGTFTASIHTPDSGPIIRDTTVTVKRAVIDRSLKSMYRDAAYPSGYTPFYLYGTSTGEKHIDHVLTRAPNSQFSAENISLELDRELGDAFQQGLLLCIDSVHEASMQPFPPTEQLLAKPNFFFRSGNTLAVTVYQDPNPYDAPGPGLVAMEALGEPLAKGTVKLGRDTYVDSKTMNSDPFRKPVSVPAWQDELDKIRKCIEHSKAAETVPKSKRPGKSTDVKDTPARKPVPVGGSRSRHEFGPGGGWPSWGPVKKRW